MWFAFSIGPGHVILHATLQGKSHLCILHGLSPNFHSHVTVSDLYIFPGSIHIFPYIKIGRPILEIYKSLTDVLYEWRNWETEHYYSVLEITVSFLGIHKWELAIYIGFSPALYLQCRVGVGSKSMLPHPPLGKTRFSNLCLSVCVGWRKLERGCWSRRATACLLDIASFICVSNSQISNLFVNYHSLK